MIRRLRKKLIIVLMVFLSLLLIAILVSLFVSAKVVYERRSDIAFDNPPPTENDSNRSLVMAMPIAGVTLNMYGEYTVTQNQIHYVTDEELIEIASSLKDEDLDVGFTSTYNLRYRRDIEPDGTIDFKFTDTFIERDTLKGQVLYSIIIGIGALAVFFVVSLLLSRWMVKPVERAWVKQRRFVTDASHELKTPADRYPVQYGHAHRIRRRNRRQEPGAAGQYPGRIQTNESIDGKPARACPYRQQAKRDRQRACELLLCPFRGRADV